MMDNGLSAADIMALTRDGNGNNNGWTDNPFIYLVWLALLGNGGIFGNRGGYGNGGEMGGMITLGRCAPTCSDLYAGFNNQDVNGQLRGITQGLCDGFYAVNTGLLQGFNGVQRDVSQGFATTAQAINNLGYQVGQGFCGVDKTIMQNGFQNQAGFNALGSQLAQCCCDMRYDMATQGCDTRNLIQSTTRDLIENQNNNARQLLDFLVQSKLDDKDAKIAELQNAVSQSNQNAVLRAAIDASTAEIIRRTGNECPVPAYVVPNPNCCYGNPLGVGTTYGLNPFTFGRNDCGCGCG